MAIRVTFRELPVAGARVEFRASPAPVSGAAAPVAWTGNDGIATFDLPPGRYFLVAQWRGDGDYGRPLATGDRYGYFGGNPVYAAKEDAREFFLTLEEVPAPPATVGEPRGGTGVAGRVLSGGEPLDNASVIAFLRADNAFRDLGFAASAPSLPDGSFVLDLPPGDYFLLVRKRAGGAMAGPMRKGDHFGYFPANPVSVHAGAYTMVAIPATMLKLRNAPMYSGKSRAAAYLEGRILNARGAPQAGVYAALYDNPELLSRPLYMSDVTGVDGRYRLPVPVPGTYFLGARTGYGGSPVPGDLFGRFEGTADHSVAVREGDLLTIDITVGEVR